MPASRPIWKGQLRLKLETRKTLEPTRFVGAAEIDPIYDEKPYFVVPSDDALRQSQKVGLGQLALRGKEYLVATQASPRKKAS